MSKDKLYILDNLFGHTHSSSWHNKPELFEWVRSLDGEHIVLTDNMLSQVDNIVGKKKYAWLVESPEITPHAYAFIKNNYEKFDSVFTFDKELLDLSDKFMLLPIGGCWIKEEDRFITEKTKNTSIILSSKKQTKGHRLRHEIAFNDVISGLDIFGFTNPIENKIEALKDYRFSVIIENTKQDYYFTEKIIDCLITGTIPIYWGCPSIGEFFDTKGFIIFDKLEDLKDVNQLLTSKNYNSKLEYIIKNYELAKNYLVGDDFIHRYITND